MKKTFIRIGFVVFLLLISIALFYSGKGHTLLLDNKTIERNGIEYKALDYADVRIDSSEYREILKRDRIKEETAGQKHRITIIYNENGEEKEIQKTFHLKVNEAIYLLSIPALIGGDENWIEVFEPLN